MPISRSLKDKRISHSSRTLVLGLSILAILSVLGLDYIASKKGERSWFFSVQKEEKKIQEDFLSDIVLQHIDRLGLSPDSVSQFKDRSGMNHLMINLSKKQYDDLEPKLREIILETESVIIKEEEKHSQDKTFYLWEIKGKNEGKLTILFSCEKEKPALKERKNKVAIIMDDMGYSLNALYDLLILKERVTIAILPFSTFAKETAQLAHQNGLEVMLHLPLESINNTEENMSTEGMILSGMSQEEVLETVEKDLGQVPHIRGVNNHMGSKITADREFMKLILQHLRRRNLYFVDSRTTGQSVAYDVARSLKVPTAQRQVFLDGETDESYIKGKMLELFRLAQSKGSALGICHPSRETLKVLQENLNLVKDYGLELVFVSQIVK